MALAFEILAIIGFFIAVLLFIGFIGIIIIIISSAERRKARRAGMKPKNAGLVTGLVMLAIPVDTFVFAVMIVAVGMMKTQIQRTTYDCYTDKLRNETVTESKVREEIIEELLEAADENDTETLKKLFAQTIQEDSSFDSQIDEFMEQYPGELSDAEYKFQGGAAGGGSHDGEKTYEFSAECTVKVDDDNYYYLHYNVVSQDTANPENVGITSLTLYSKEAEVLRIEAIYADEDDGSEGYSIYSKTEVDRRMNVKVIEWEPYKYYDFDRTITKEQAESACKGAERLVDITDKLGIPNADDGKYLGTAYYELTPDSKKDPIYLYISYSGTSDTDEIYSAYFVYKDGTDWDNALI